MTALPDRPRLARGTKLTVQHVFTTIGDVESRLETPSLDHENMSQPRARFRVAINVPVIDSRMFEGATAVAAIGRLTLGWPVPLPPLQPNLSAIGRYTDVDLTYRLEEVSISFDQRAEPAAIESPFGTTEARVRYDAIAALDLTIGIVEKTPEHIDNNAGTTPTREVWSASLPPVAFASPDFRFNPFAWTGLSQQIDPYRFYMVQLDAQQLIDGNAVVGNRVVNCCLPSMQITLTFSQRVRVRSKTADNISNLPIKHGGAQTGPPISITTPAGNANLTASGAAGLRDEIILLDEQLRNRIPGGYRKDANVPPRESLIETTCYDIIAIPMLNNLGNNRAWVAEYADDFPFTAGGNYNAVTGDERWVKITFPFVIHHVIAVTNYCRGESAVAVPPELRGILPTSTSLTNTVGVMLMTGVRGDYLAAQQVAFGSWTVANKGALTIDRMRVQAGQLHTWGDVNFELLQIPLVNSGAAGVGMNNISGVAIPQGTPFFVGKGTSITRARSNAADFNNVPGLTATLGLEQYLLVRWTLDDSVSLGGTRLHPGPGGAGADNEVYSGFGGSMVYLVCEKNLCGLQYALSMDQMHPLNR